LVDVGVPPMNFTGETPVLPCQVVSRSSIRDTSQRKKPEERDRTREQYADYRTPWVLRRSKLGKALRDMEVLHTAASAYYVDFSSYPPQARCLTTPVAYMNALLPDVCAPRGPYGYTRSWQWHLQYAFVSTGPDGVRDISLIHFMLTRVLQGKPPWQLGRSLLFVRWSKTGYESGYEYSSEFASGADVVSLGR